jgi:hypothetical protein
MFYRTDCKHEFINSTWDRRCKKCKLNGYQIGTEDEELTAAEKEHGPFGARHAMFKAIGNGATGLNHFMILDKDGKWLAYAIGAACYYQLMQHGVMKEKMQKEGAFIWDWPFGGSGKKTPAFKKTVWKKTGGSKGWASKFYNWMANESPYAKAFVVKDWVQAFEDGILYDTNFEAHALMSVMSGVRYIGEFPHIAQSFAVAKDHFENGMMALLAAHYFKIGEDGTAHSETHSSNHAMWNNSYFNALEHTKNMLEGRLVTPPESGSMKQKWAWYNCIQTFGKAPKNADYWNEPTPGKHVFKLPETQGKQARDIFGGIYIESKKIPVEDWLDAFEEEVLTWELKSPS